MRVEVGKDLITYGTIATSGTGLIYSGNSDLLKTIVKEARVITGPAVSDEKMLSLFPMLYRNRQWARILPDQKFNPYHDAQGRFDTSDSGQIAAPGQPELPGMPIGLNPGAFNQPQLFGKPSTGAFTSPITAIAGVETGIGATSTQLFDAKETNGQQFGHTFNDTYKVDVNGQNFFVKQYNETPYGSGQSYPGGETQLEQEQTARDAAVLVGVGNLTPNMISWQGDDGNNYMAQKWDTGMTTYAQDEEKFNQAVANLSDAQVTTAHLYEYTTGDADHNYNGGNYAVDASGTLKILDFGLAYNTEDNPLQHQQTLLYDAIIAQDRPLDKNALNVFVSHQQDYIDLARKNGLSSASITDLSKRLWALKEMATSGDATWKTLDTQGGYNSW